MEDDLDNVPFSMETTNETSAETTTSLTPAPFIEPKVHVCRSEKSGIEIMKPKTEYESRQLWQAVCGKNYHVMFKTFPHNDAPDTIHTVSLNRRGKPTGRPIVCYHNGVVVSS